MKKFSAICLFIAGLILAACSEEESALLFTVESNSEPENVKMEYYSPDPSCVAKMYWIDANSCASTISIKCTNANDISIENHEGKVSEGYLCTSGLWRAEVVNSNTITFTFEEVCNEPEDAPYIDSMGFNVVAQTDKGTVRTGIYVNRLMKSTESVLGAF